MKIKSIIGILCLSLCLLIAPAAAAGGSGTSANPYQIETAAELQSIQNDLSAHYILMNDIDLTDVTWMPLGSTSAAFFGELDGNGHTISNLNLSATTQSAGLFGVLTSGATIKDLTLEDFHVESTSPQSGCLIGSVIMSESTHETATLSNIELIRCYIKTPSSSTANIIGRVTTSASVNIIDCTVSQCTSEITSGYDIGNIIGYCGGGSTVQITGITIEYSSVKSPNPDVGNIVGYLVGSSSMIIENSKVVSCIAEASGHSVANIIGRCAGSSSANVENIEISNCIVKGSAYGGGIFGSSADSGSSISANSCVITDCTIVTTSNYAGGVAGRVLSGTTGLFTNCTVTDCTVLANAYAAGICPAYS